MPEMLAANCCVPPKRRETVPGVTVTEGAETERVVDALSEPDAAAIVLVPALRAFACPLGLIVATAGFEELQLTEFVASCDVPSV
jgi:hypothetical protein